jgi:hypothetical protein
MISDLHPFMEDGPHSYENILSDGHPVNDGSMTDMTVPPTLLCGPEKYGRRNFPEC